jgi:hypothetical protein
MWRLLCRNLRSELLHQLRACLFAPSRVWMCRLLIEKLGEEHAPRVTTVAEGCHYTVSCFLVIMALGMHPVVKMCAMLRTKHEGHFR